MFLRYYKFLRYFKILHNVQHLRNYISNCLKIYKTKIQYKFFESINNEFELYLFINRLIYYFNCNFSPKIKKLFKIKKYKDIIKSYLLKNADQEYMYIKNYKYVSFVDFLKMLL